MIIDWSCKEARGCDWVLVSVSNQFRFYKEKPNFLGNPISDRWTLYKRPKAEQMKETIYTKEMHERGETVGSGMTATYKDKEVLIRLGCDTFRNVVFRLDGEWVTVSVDDIKPIDMRTDREKTIDDIKRKIVNRFTVSPAIANVIFGEIRSGNIHGITFTGDK